MFCEECGKLIKDSSRFCPYCGASTQEEPALKEETTSGSSETYKASGKPKKKGRAVKVLVGIVLLLAVLAAGVFLWLYNNPKLRVAYAIGRTYTDVIGTESGISKELGLKKLQKGLLEGKSRQTGEAELPLLGWKLNMEDVRDVPEQRSAKKAGLQARDGAEVSLEWYENPESVTFRVPELYSSYFYVEKEDFWNKLNDSALYAMIRSEIKDKTGVELGDISQDLDEAKKTIFWQFMEESAPEWKTMAQNMTVKKAEKKAFTIDGKKKRCQGYEVVVRGKDMQKLTEIFSDVLTERLEENEAASQAAKMVSGYDDVSKEIEWLTDRVTEEFEENDLTLTIYTGPRGRMVGAEWSDEIMLDEREPFLFEASLELTGAENPIDEFNAVLTVTDQSVEGQFITMEAKRSMKTDKAAGKFRDQTELNLTIAEAYWVVNIEDNERRYEVNRRDGHISLDSKYDYGTGDWNSKLSAYTEGDDYQPESVTITASGSLTDVEKGKSLHFTLDKLTADASMMSFEIPIAKVDYSARVYDKKEKLSILEPSKAEEQIDLLNISQAQLLKIGISVAGKAFTLIPKLGLDMIF